MEFERQCARACVCMHDLYLQKGVRDARGHVSLTQEGVVESLGTGGRGYSTGHRAMRVSQDEGSLHASEGKGDVLCPPTPCGSRLQEPEHLLGHGEAFWPQPQCLGPHSEVAACGAPGSCWQLGSVLRLRFR